MTTGLLWLVGTLTAIYLNRALGLTEGLAASAQPLSSGACLLVLVAAYAACLVAWLAFQGLLAVRYKA